MREVTNLEAKVTPQTLWRWWPKAPALLALAGPSPCQTWSSQACLIPVALCQLQGLRGDVQE